MTNIPLKQKMWMGVALLHLSLVALGASGAQVNATGVPGEAYDLYNRLTGSGFGFGFFAPGIENMLVARFTVVDSHGQAREVPLARGLNREADLRMGNVVDKFALSQEEEDPRAARDFRRSFSASLARVFFVRYPGARRVIVELDDYEPVSRVAYLRSEKPKVTTIYHAEFSYNPRQARNEQP